MVMSQMTSSGELDQAQNTVIAQARFTEEHNMPVVQLFERFRLGKGNSTLRIPKVGQMTSSDLTEGIDMVDSEDIDMSVVNATTAEVGLKVVLTWKLLRQFNEDVFSLVGTQMGDAHARKKDRDGIALFTALNGGTEFGADNKNFSVANVAAAIAKAKANKMGNSLNIVHHPNAVFYLSNSLAVTGTTYPLPQRFNSELLGDFWTGVKIAGVPIFEDGNIDKITGVDSGEGAIFSKGALGYLTSQEKITRRVENVTLRAWEIVMVEDYGMFEIDDTRGAPLQYEIGDPTTSA